MRWKLLRRRLSITAPRMTVRSHLPWPLRWALAALALGFSAAIALWAFEFGKDIAGLDRDAKQELGALRDEVQTLRSDREKAQAIANTADSLLKAEKVAQDRLAEQLRQSEAENLVLKEDLGFFEHLLPAAGPADQGPQIRGFQADAESATRTHFQLLVMMGASAGPGFQGRYDVTLAGTLDGKPWTQAMSGGPQPLQIRRYLRVEGRVEHPAQAVVKTAQVRVTDSQGRVRVTQLARL